MKSQEWNTYRTRFLVKAKQLTSTLSFTDHLGRQHCGRKGDYLVESYEGVLSIAPRHIFEDIYVPMSAHATADAQLCSDEVQLADSMCDLNHIEVRELKVEKIREAKFRFPINDSPHKHAVTPVRGRRKSPQPVRDPATRVGLM
jgi:hypothetical protein